MRPSRSHAAAALLAVTLAGLASLRCGGSSGDDGASGPPGFCESVQTYSQTCSSSGGSASTCDATLAAGCDQMLGVLNPNFVAAAGDCMQTATASCSASPTGCLSYAVGKTTATDAQKKLAQDFCDKCVPEKLANGCTDAFFAQGAKVPSPGLLLLPLGDSVAQHVDEKCTAAPFPGAPRGACGATFLNCAQTAIPEALGSALPTDALKCMLTSFLANPPTIGGGDAGGDDAGADETSTTDDTGTTTDDTGSTSTDSGSTSNDTGTVTSETGPHCTNDNDCTGAKCVLGVCTIVNCGNGRIDTGEQCDDANAKNGDGCDANCNVECSQGDQRYVDPITYHCYEHFNATKTWTAALADCAGRSMHLVTIVDAAETSNLTLLPATGWIGLTDGRDVGDSKSGPYHWIDSTPFNYTNWGSGQPDDAKTCTLGFNCKYEHCGETRADGTWNDNNCENGLSYTCEREPAGR